jgi:hypothetical protein
MKNLGVISLLVLVVFGYFVFKIGRTLLRYTLYVSAIIIPLFLILNAQAIAKYLSTILVIT